MKITLWIIVILMGITIINELFYIGKTSLAFILIIFSVSVGAMAYIQINQIK